jgi:hypothetical protein
MIAEDQEEFVEKVRGVIGEHFHCFAFAVLDDEGNLHYEYTNPHIGRMLFADSLEDMHTETGIEEWVWEEEDDDE